MTDLKQKMPGSSRVMFNCLTDISALLDCLVYIGDKRSGLSMSDDCRMSDFTDQVIKLVFGRVDAAIADACELIKQEEEAGK